MPKKNSLLSRIRLMAAGKLPGIRKQKGKLRAEQVRFQPAFCFPCALCAQAARFHRAARERRDTSKLLIAIAAFPAKNTALFAAFSGSEKADPGPCLPALSPTPKREARQTNPLSLVSWRAPKRSRPPGDRFSRFHRCPARCTYRCRCHTAAPCCPQRHEDRFC